MRVKVFQWGKQVVLYGANLILISVIVNGRGDLIYSTTRWNEGEKHGDIGKMGISPDKALSEMDLGKLVGESFYDAFPPREE